MNKQEIKVIGTCIGSKMDLNPIIYELLDLRADVQDLDLTKEEIIASLEEAIANIQALNDPKPDPFSVKIEKKAREEKGEA